MVKTNQDNGFNDNKLTNIDSVTVNRDLTSDKQLVNRKCLDYELDKKTILRFNKRLENYLKVSFGNDTFNLTKHNKIQLTDTTIIRNGKSGSYLLPSWRIFCNDKNNNGKITKFIRSTKTK